MIIPVLLGQITKRMTKSNKLIGIGLIEDLTSKMELVFSVKY